MKRRLSGLRWRAAVMSAKARNVGAAGKLNDDRIPSPGRRLVFGETAPQLAGLNANNGIQPGIECLRPLEYFGTNGILFDFAGRSCERFPNDEIEKSREPS